MALYGVANVVVWPIRLIVTGMLFLRRWLSFLLCRALHVNQAE